MKPVKKTKIVCTIGPATQSEERLTEMLKAGMNIMRLNFSHGDFAEHQGKVDNLRKVMKKTGMKAAIMQDLSGPKFRIGDFYQERVQLKAGDFITLTTEKIVGDEKRVSVNYPTLHEVKGKAEMGNRAKGIYRFYRRRNNILEKYGVVGIMINQVRKKVGASMFEAAETMPGGDSTRFYASNRIMVTRSKQIKGYLDEKGKWQDSKEKGKKIGQNVKVDVYKNKTSPPKPAVMTEVYFQDKKYEYVGFNRYSNVEELLLEAGVITKKGSRYYYGEEMLCNGEANFNPLMHSKPKLRKKLLDALDLNTISKTRARIEAIGKNLYPIKSKKSNEDGDDE
jgi:hypothetical protein